MEVKSIIGNVSVNVVRKHLSKVVVCALEIQKVAGVRNMMD